jgi:predicted dehydrogenase
VTDAYRARWRVGILSGTGTALKRTIPALLSSTRCRTTVVHGRSPDRLAAVRKLDPAIRVTASTKEFASWRDDYDFVAIGSPPFLHADQIELAMKLGKPVICEKPLIANREEYDRVATLLEDAPQPFMLAHQVRHQPAVSALTELIRGRTLGSAVAVDLRWCFTMNHTAANARWKLRPDRGGSSAMFDSGVHAVDLALALFGLPDRVVGMAHSVRSANSYDTVTSLLDYPDFTVHLSTSQSASARDNGLRLVLPTAVVQAPGLLGESSCRTMRVQEEGGERSMEFDAVNLYRATVEDFALFLEDGTWRAGTTATEALQSSRLMFALEDSIRSNSIVTVPRT